MKDNRRKEIKNVKKQLKRMNKQLKEDCFAGRFELRKIKQKDFQEPNYLVYTPWCFTIDDAGDPTWRHSLYYIELVDNEDTSRNVVYVCKYSEHFGLCDLVYDINLSNDKNCPGYESDGGLSILFWAINNFIIKSDFWKKWDNDIEYMKTHWFSGAELNERLKSNKDYESPEKFYEMRKEKC